MKTQAEYQKIYRERLCKTKGYTIIHFLVNRETNLAIEKLAKKLGSSKGEVLNYLHLSEKKEIIKNDTTHTL